MDRTEDSEALRADALAAWMAGLAAVDPERCVHRALSARPGIDPLATPTLVLAVGKAAAGMMRGALGLERGALGVMRGALGLERGAPGMERGALPAPDARARAIVLLPEGTGAGALPPEVLVLRGGHPHPTREGAESTLRILAEVDRLGRGERLLLLLSGGASALLEVPPPGLAFDELVLAHRALVASGLAIRDINLVRGCLSAVKAGRLAERAHPAAVTTLAISDVEGDDPAVIGSGPTVPPARTRADACREALGVVRRAGVLLSPAAIAVLERGAAAAGALPTEVAAPDFTVVASIEDAVRAARAELARRGYHVIDSDAAYLRGDTRAAAARLGRTLAKLEAGSAAGPCAAVIGGETTVAVTAPNPGRGGRNLDLAARVALALDGRGGLAVAVAGTDGCDGSSRAAGALVDAGSAARATCAGRPLEQALAVFDTEAALDAAGDLVVTGPTGTNVGDLVVAVASEG